MMDFEQQALFLESPLTLAVAIAAPVVIAAAASFGCGKKREPTKEELRKRKAAKSSKSKRATSKRSTSVAGSSKKSKSSKSSKSGKTKSAKGGKSKRSTKGNKDKSRTSKDTSTKSTKKSKRSETSSKKVKRDKSKSGSLKEQSTQKSSKKDDNNNVKPSNFVEADKQAAVMAHAAAIAAAESKQSKPPSEQVDESIKNTQRTSSQKALPSQGSAEQNMPNVIGISNGMKTQPVEPIIPIELQLLSQFYSDECLLLNNRDGQSSIEIAKMFKPPRSLLDSTHEIKMEPAELRWSAAGGLQKISIMNQTLDRQAIKVKCSDNNVYRVNPVFAFIEPGQTLNVDVMRQNGTNKVDKIVFMTAKASYEDQNPRALFKQGIQGSMMVLPLLATQPASIPVAAN